MSKHRPTLYGPSGQVLPPSKRAGYLYGNNLNRPNQYRPRYYNATDTSKAVNMSDRNNLVSLSREMFSQMPDINGAIVQKATWAFGTAWRPQFNGVNKEWGKAAVEWLENSWYPIANTRGSAFDFRTSLFLSSIAVDTDGDQLMILVRTPSGFPQIQFVPAHRIGCRNYNETVVKSGPYRGLNLVDGVILNKSNRPVAYRILGDTEDDDYDVSAKQCSLIVEPTWADQVRGIPRLASAILDTMDLGDIEDFLKKQIKIQSTIGLLHQNEQGAAPEGDDNIITDEEDTENVLDETSNAAPAIELMDGGTIMYIKAGTGKIDAFKSDTPSANTDKYLDKLQKRILWSLGWPSQLLNPETVGGASVRLVTDLARQSIQQRQNTIEKRAKLAVAFAVARAMDMDVLPSNFDDRWWDFSFSKPATIVVDSGYERAADINDLKMGIKSMSCISAKAGENWVEVRTQTQVETEDLIDRANDISKRKGISFDKALDLLQQRGPNPVTTTETTNNNVEQQPQENTEETETL